MTTTGAPIKSLTPEQAQAVADQSKRLLVVASAGSGKTEVLARRLMRVLQDSAGQSFRCLAVTYTVKAAQELRQRITASAAAEHWRVDANTLHGFALEWLRQYGSCVNVGPDVVVYADDADRARLINEYVASLGLQDAVGADEMAAMKPVLAQIDAHRTDHPGEPYPDDGHQFFGVPMTELFDGYLEALDSAGGIDFPGMLTKLLEALSADPWIGQNFRSLFRHIFVDEAQDLTTAQTLLLKRLAGDQLSIFAVADDKQSINGFAGGKFENACVLVGDDAAARPLALPHNFRSSALVLQAAERLAENFAIRPLPAALPATAPPGVVSTVECADPRAEAHTVGAWVDALLNGGLDPTALAHGEDPSVAPETIAVIGRSRWLLDPVLAQLELHGFPSAVDVASSGFLSTPEGRILLDAFAAELNAADAPAKRRIVDELDGLGVATTTTDYLDALTRSKLPTLEAVGRAAALARDGADLDRIFAAVETSDTSTWAHDVGELATLWANYCATTQAKLRTLAGFLRFATQSQRVRPTDPGVRVMTIHKVKGLEFRAVAVVGVREGSLPDYRAATQEEVDAERRSFYVAITRASRSLLVTWPRTTMDRYGRAHHQSPSRFIAEAGLQS